MPSIDPTKVPLVSSSVCIFVVQAHLLLPPPLSRRRSPPPLTLHSSFVDWPVHHILKNCLLPDTNIVRDRVHPTLLEHVFCGWVDPHLVWSFPGPMRLSHPVCSPDVKPLQPRQCSLGEVPCLAAVEEDPLYNRLIELELTFGGVLSAWRTCPTRAHIPRAFLSWLRTALMSSSSWARIRLRYRKDSTFSKTSPST
jgi:hypothetical protein